MTSKCQALVVGHTVCYIYYNVIESLQLTNNHHFKFHESHSVAAVVVATSQYCIELGGY